MFMNIITTKTRSITDMIELNITVATRAGEFVIDN
jgi:hypothetical protein